MGTENSTKLHPVDEAFKILEQGCHDGSRHNVLPRCYEFLEQNVQDRFGIGVDIEDREQYYLILAGRFDRFLRKIDSRLANPRLTDTPDMLARLKQASEVVHDYSSEFFGTFLEIQALEILDPETDGPSLVMYYSQKVRYFRLIGNDLLAELAESQKQYHQTCVDEEIAYIEQRRVLGSQKQTDLSGEPNVSRLPPLLRILTDPETTHAQIGLLIEELLPGFSHSSLSSQAQKSKFLAALTGKKAETFRSKWNDTFGEARLGSRRHRTLDGPAIRAFTEEIETYLKEKKLL